MFINNEIFSIIMLNKRGDLGTEEIVKIVLAIAVFVVIIILAVALIKIVNSNLKQEQAESTLERLVFEIDRIGYADKEVFLIDGPKDWFLFIRNDTSDNKTLCICPHRDTTYRNQIDLLVCLNSVDLCKKTKYSLDFFGENIKYLQIIDIPYQVSILRHSYFSDNIDKEVVSIEHNLDQDQSSKYVPPPVVVGPKIIGRNII